MNKKYIIYKWSLIALLFCYLIGLLISGLGFRKDYQSYLVIILIPNIIFIGLYLLFYLINKNMTKRIIILRSYILFIIINFYLISIILITYLTNNKTELNEYRKIINYMFIILSVTIILLVYSIINVILNYKYLKLALLTNKKYDEIYDSNLTFSAKNDLIKKLNYYFINKDYAKIEKINLDNNLLKDIILNSYYKGNFFKIIWHKLLRYILLTITFGLAYPYVKCANMRDDTLATVYDNYNLQFDGSAKTLVLKWLKWCLLCVITLGIYALFITNKVRKYNASNTHIIGLKAKNNGDFTGLFIVGFCIDLVCIVVNIGTLFIAWPFTKCWQSKWYYSHLYLDGYGLIFCGKGRSLLKKWLFWLGLSVITLGIFAIYNQRRIKKWEVANTHLAQIYNSYSKNQVKNVKLIKLV